MAKPIVLASGSPRRRELLTAAGIHFVVRPADVDETALPSESPEAHVRRLAEKKALAVPIEPGETVLGADTVVALHNEILGKPRDADHAREMLKKLSGRCHKVFTGVCLRTPGTCHTEFSCTNVWFDSLSAREIEAYIESGEPFDKAGGYAIQGLASKHILKIEGSYSNVVGLPVELVYRLLRPHIIE